MLRQMRNLEFEVIADVLKGLRTGVGSEVELRCVGMKVCHYRMQL